MAQWYVETESGWVAEELDAVPEGERLERTGSTTATPTGRRGDVYLCEDDGTAWLRVG